MNNKKKRSLAENVRMILRAFKISCREIGIKRYVVFLIYQTMEATYMLPNIYLGARVITELTGACRSQELIKLALTVVLVNALLQFMTSVFTRYADYCFGLALMDLDHMLVDKMTSMDFIDAEHGKNHELYALIMQNKGLNGRGLYEMLFELPRFIGGIVKTIGSAAMAVTLFSLKLPEGSDMKFLESPLTAVGMLGLACASVFLPPYLMSIPEKIRAANNFSIREWYRKFDFFGFTLPSDAERAQDVRMYSQEFTAEILTSDEGRYGKFGKDYMSSYIWYENLGGFINCIFKAVTYIFVALKSLCGAFGVGSVVMYVGAITQFTQGIGDVVSGFTSLMINNEYLEPVYQYLDIPNNMYQGSLCTEKRADRKYEIEFRDVSFRYPDSDIYALRHVSMKFQVGSRLAVVGMNGSGKTTFIKLLCRLYDPTEGEILLNGIDIRKYDYHDYMKLFSVVFQDFKLLPFALGENVAASARYEKEKVLKCLRDAGFDQRLEELPGGLHTVLYKEFDESGVEISGGEAQKLAIARALYKNAPFIILDEPTAALDPIAEAEIYSKFNDIVGDKTAIYISHRLSSCKFCDEIVVFHEGAVVQRGTHRELLLDTTGKYNELWYAQAQYYTNGQ